jgi:hypothetical protein
MRDGRAPHPQGGVLLVEVGDDLSDAGHMDYPAVIFRVFTAFLVCILAKD